MLRDDIRCGDKVLFYHSNAGKETGVVGTAEVVTEGYPDHTAQDPHSDHPDPKHTDDNPIWYMVDIRFESKFARIVSLQELRNDAHVDGLTLLRKGNRLSISEVSQERFNYIVSLSNN